MYAILVSCNGKDRVVASTRFLHHQMLASFLKDVFDCNEREINDNLEYSYSDGTFECMNFSGTFRRISILTC